MRLAINGFGRIGRIFLRNVLNMPGVEVVAINDVTDTATLAHLFKYDSVHRGFKGTVTAGEDELIINGTAIKVLAEKDPSALPWKALDIDLIIEATGKFASMEGAGKHLAAGARQVIISAPASGKNVPTIVLGVNDNEIDLHSPVISNASCTTNNVAAMVKVLDDNWGVKEGYITTIHSMTGDQNLHDAPHKDLRRARAASASIIPTTTGAAKAITTIFPHLYGKLGGAGIRVPVLNGSLTDFTCVLNKPATVEEINAAFKTAAEGPMKNILEYTEDPIVSTDILGNTHSCIFDAQLTSVVGGLTKVVGWYDNEMGYSGRLADLVERILSGQESGNKDQDNNISSPLGKNGVRFITADEVLPLRNEVLREGRLTLDECRWPGDENEGSFHLGYFVDNKLICIASFYTNAHESFVGLGYQLRGTATAEQYRGKGYGNQLVNFAVVYLRGQKANYVWCNARKKASKFYSSLGFEIISNEFDIPGIGPHFKMYLKIQ